MFIQPFKHWLDTIFCITQTLLMSFVSAFHLHHSLSSFPHNTTFHTICSSFFPLFLSPIYFLFFAFHYLSNWISLSVCPSPAFLFSFFFSLLFLPFPPTCSSFFLYLMYSLFFFAFHYLRFCITIPDFFPLTFLIFILLFSLISKTTPISLLLLHFFSLLSPPAFPLCLCPTPKTPHPSSSPIYLSYSLFLCSPLLHYPPVFTLLHPLFSLLYPYPTTKCSKTSTLTNIWNLIFGLKEFGLFAGGKVKSTSVLLRATRVVPKYVLPVKSSVTETLTVANLRHLYAKLLWYSRFKISLISSSDMWNECFPSSFKTNYYINYSGLSGFQTLIKLIISYVSCEIIYNNSF